MDSGGGGRSEEADSGGNEVDFSSRVRAEVAGERRLGDVCGDDFAKTSSTLFGITSGSLAGGN